MELVEKKLALGKDLEFYARFPEEIDMLGEIDEEESEINRGHFDLSVDEYSALVSRVEEIAESASNQAKAIIDSYISRVIAINGIKIEKIKRQGKWKCKLNCLPNRGMPPSRRIVMTGLMIFTHENTLTAVGWFWVRGVERSKILEVLEKDAGNAGLKNRMPDGWEEDPFGWGEEDTLCFVQENLRKVAENGESLDDLADRLASPILRITQERWREFFELVNICSGSD